MFYCKSAGKAKGCDHCVNNPIHQLTESRRHSIAPTVSRSGDCKQYIETIKRQPEPSQ